MATTQRPESATRNQVEYRPITPVTPVSVGETKFSDGSPYYAVLRQNFQVLRPKQVIAIGKGVREEMVADEKLVTLSCCHPLDFPMKIEEVIQWFQDAQKDCTFVLFGSIANHHANGYSPRKGGEKAGDYAGKLALDRFNRPIYQRVKLGIVGQCTPGFIDRCTEDPDDCSPLPQDIVDLYRQTMAVRDEDDKVRSKRIPAPIAAQLAVGSRIEAPSDDDLNACEL